jgi:hypothetical protein
VIFGAAAGVADTDPTIVIPGSVTVEPGTAAGTMMIVAQNGGTVTFLDPAMGFTLHSRGVEITGIDPSFTPISRSAATRPSTPPAP